MYLKERQGTRSDLPYGVVLENPDKWDEETPAPWAEQASDYQEIEQSPLEDLSDQYQVLDGFWDVLGKGAGYVYGAVKVGTAIGTAITQRSGDPTMGGRIGGAMAAARTVGEQLVIWNDAINSLQQRMGRKLTAQEYIGLEQQVWGPGGAPTGLPAGGPPVSGGAAPFWFWPAIIAGAWFLFFRRR